MTITLQHGDIAGLWYRPKPGADIHAVKREAQQMADIEGRDILVVFNAQVLQFEPRAITEPRQILG